MDHTVQQLKKLGFNEYEAKSYVSLVKQGPVTAYQVSKESGIPRARIYEVLGTLCDKGIVMKEEINDTTRYSPLPVEIFLQKVQSEWQSTYSVISESLKELETSEEKVDNRVITLKDYNSIITYCQTLIRKAERRIVISMWNDMYEVLKKELAKAAERVPLQGITIHVQNPIKHIEKHRITQFENPSAEHWFILSIDSKEMIYGPSTEERTVAFYTDDSVHIFLLEDYIWHDVLVNRLVKHSQDHNLEDWITKERKSFFTGK